MENTDRLNDEAFMKKAIELSRLAVAHGNESIWRSACQRWRDCIYK